MQFNRITWYSKLLALVLFVALPFIGFYLGMKFQEATGSQVSLVTVINPIVATKSATKSGSQNVNLKTSYTNGSLKYSGSVDVPTPCHELKEETKILESFPEQVQIQLTIVNPNPSQICTQVITSKSFSGEVKTSSDAKISVYLDGKLVQ